MFKSIGSVIVLFACAHFFINSFHALDKALVATFNTLEVVAVVASGELEQLDTQ